MKALGSCLYFHSCSVSQTLEKLCLEPWLLHGSVVCVQTTTSSELPANTIAAAKDAEHTPSEHLTGLDP